MRKPGPQLQYHTRQNGRVFLFAAVSARYRIVPNQNYETGS